MEASITIKKIAKIIKGQTILADLSVGIEKGSSFVLIGENGSGKSMFLKILSGLVDKDFGSIYIKGMNSSTRGSEVRALTGYMPQDIDLDPNINVMQNISLYGQLHGLNKEQSDNRALNLLNDFNLEKNAYDFDSILPKGKVRVIQYIRSIIHNPDILLLDEPTKDIDPHFRKLIWKSLDKMQLKKTIIIATQDFREAERYADRIAILHNGNIQMDGSLDKLIESTKGLTRYRLFFKENISDDFIVKVKEFTRIIKANVNGRELEFYAKDRMEFFNVLKISLDFQLSNIDTSFCSLQDLFIGLTDGGFE